MSDSVLMSETYFKSRREAREEAARIKELAVENEMLIKIEKSPYGGYCLKILPIDIVLDMPDVLYKRAMMK